MASCNLNYSGHTGVINASASVQELSTSGKTRTVRVTLYVWAIDYSGNRDSAYSVYCANSGTNVSVGKYQGFYINGDAQAIFDETFTVSLGAGQSTAGINLSFSALLYSSGAKADRKISGTITELYLTQEPAASASSVSCASSARMGGQVLISINRSQSNVTHNLYYTFGGVETLMATGVGSSYTWAIPDLAARCNNALSGNCTIRCVTYLGGSWIGESRCSLTLEVPTYSRVSVAGSSAEMGSTKSVEFPRYSSNFTVVLSLDWQGSTAELARGQINSCNWTPGYDMAKSIPNLTYGTATLRCTTYNGSAKVGEDSTSVSVKVPNNEVTQPKISGINTSIVTKLEGALAKAYIRGMSGVRVETAASSEYSAISGYDVRVGSSRLYGNPATAQTIQESGDVTIAVTVTDARGFTATASTSITVLPYQEPSIAPCTGEKNVVCDRAAEDGTLSTGGVYLAIRAKKTFSSLKVDGVEQNGCYLQYRYKAANAASYSGWTVLLSENADAETKVTLGNIVPSTVTSYLVEMQTVDKLGNSKTLAFQISTEHVSFALFDGEDGAAFGKYPEEPHVVDIAEHMTLRVRGKMEMKNAIIGLAYSENVQGYAHSRITGKSDVGEKCCLRVENGNHVYIGLSCYIPQGMHVNHYGQLCKDGYTSNSLDIALTSEAIPKEYRPPNGRMVFPIFASNSDIGRKFLQCSIYYDGKIQLDYANVDIKTMPEGSTVSGLSCSGYFDYWI
ncbi:MAG: DUF859 family phage minor structural protein [Candidatus Faecousia sp.]|nr:DUF859 family phage minor structural protein [Candidatus Faecousia sp.]